MRPIAKVRTVPTKQSITIYICIIHYQQVHEKITLKGTYGLGNFLADPEHQV